MRALFYSAADPRKNQNDQYEVCIEAVNPVTNIEPSSKSKSSHTDKSMQAAAAVQAIYRDLVMYLAGCFKFSHYYSGVQLSRV